MHSSSLFRFLMPLVCILYTGCLLAENLFWVDAELLYLKAYEKSFVLTNKTSPVFTTDNYTKTEVLHPDFDWDFGSRVSIGCYSPCYCFDALFAWTHYHSSLNQKQLTDSNDLTNVNNQQGMFPIWSLSKDIIAGDYVSEAYMKGKLTFDLFDLDFGYPVCFYENLTINPYVGLRGAWIRQSGCVNYVGGIFLIGIIDGGIPLNGTDYIHLRNDFWGVGPRVGFDLDYCLGNGFSFYGNAAASGLLGVFDIHQNEIYLNSVRSCYSKHNTRFRCILDFAAGVAWNTCLCCGKYGLCLRLGWEYHIFFDQMQLKQDAFHLVPKDRDLSVQGVSASACFQF